MDTLPPHAQNGNSLPIPAASGIYQITCLSNGKIYIGSAVNLRQRKGAHWTSLRGNRHPNSHLQHAWNKYGERAFVFEVIELVLMREMLIAREQHWFKELNPFGKSGFNIYREAGSPLGTKQTPEQIEKMRQTKLGRKQTPEHIRNRTQQAIGRKQSPEWVEKNRQSHLGLKPTPETREKMRLSQFGRSPETREKQRQKLLGRKQTPEHIEKRIQPHRGMKRSPEAVENIRQAQRLRRERERKEKLHDQGS